MNNPQPVLIMILFWAFHGIHAQTADVNASVDTKDMLFYYQGLKEGCHIIFGQNLGHGDAITTNYNPLVEQVFVNTGKRLALVGSEYGFSTQPDLFAANLTLINHWKTGGIVTISWRANNPWNGMLADNIEHQGETGLLVTPGNQAYDSWMNQLTQIGDVLEMLRDSGVVVLWRPLPEMNGTWFWWGHSPGSTDTSSFINLWKQIFQYLTEERQLHNLLWVYSVSHSFDSPVDLYYPGDEFVDIVGINIFDDNAAYIYPADYDKLKALGKPMGLTEFAPTLPHPIGNYDYTILLENLQNMWDDYVFSYSWHDFPGGINSYAGNLNENLLLQDPCAITLDDIQLSLSSNQILPDKNFSLYPNPVDENCLIRSNSPNLTIDQLSVFDSNGKCLEIISLSSQQNYVFNTAALRAGIYCILIESNGKLYPQKLAKY